MVLLAHPVAQLSACSKCRDIAGRTGNGSLETRFAELLHAKSDTTLRNERNRATTVRNERENGVRPAISVRNEQRCRYMGSAPEIPCSDRAKRAGECSERAERARKLQRPCRTSARSHEPGETSAPPARTVRNERGATRDVRRPAFCAYSSRPNFRSSSWVAVQAGQSHHLAPCAMRSRWWAAS